MQMRQILLLIGATLLLFGGLSIYLLWDHPEPAVLRHQLGLEVTKLLVQFMLTVILGGIVIQMYNRRNAQKLSEEDQRRSFLKQLTEAMAVVTRSRLSLCANAAGIAPADTDTPDMRTLPWDVYDRQMVCIGDAHLEVKLLYEELKGDSDLFSDVKEALLPELGIIVEYLDDLKDEYRDDAIDSINQDKQVSLTALKKLSHFARSRNGTSISI